MELFSNLAIGFGIALSPYTLMLAVIGCFIGTIIGALPGLGPSNGRGNPDPSDVHNGLGCNLGSGSYDFGLLWRDVWRADQLDPSEHPR